MASIITKWISASFTDKVLGAPLSSPLSSTSITITCLCRPPPLLKILFHLQLFNWDNHYLQLLTPPPSQLPKRIRDRGHRHGFEAVVAWLVIACRSCLSLESPACRLCFLKYQAEKELNLNNKTNISFCRLRKDIKKWLLWGSLK